MRTKASNLIVLALADRHTDIIEPPIGRYEGFYTSPVWHKRMVYIVVSEIYIVFDFNDAFVFTFALVIVVAI